MTELPSLAAAALGVVDDVSTRLWVALKHRSGALGPVAVLPFRGHAEHGRLHLRGRVLEHPGITRGTATDPWWRNLRAMLRRFASVEIPGATVRVSVDGAAAALRTDRQGYFQLSTDAPAVDSGEPRRERWIPVSAEVVRPLGRGQQAGTAPATAPAAALMPSPDARFAVVSDLDDTVIATGLTGALTAARIVLLNNARSRAAFPGVAAFYQALREGPAGSAINPLFYVSGGPWNLYDLLVEFLDHHGVPPGPLLLTEWTMDPRTLGSRATIEHKHEQIARLIAAYPDLPFVLIGDSGQHDPEIYRDVVAEHPGRVAAAYIRDVTDARRHAEVEAIAADVARRGVPLVLARDSAAAARHAAGVGLIDPDALSDIDGGTAADIAGSDSRRGRVTRSG